MTQQKFGKWFHCAVFPHRFYIHNFHAVPNILSILNPQVNLEMSHNLLLLQYYQSKRRRVEAVYGHFLQSIPTFFFYGCSFQGCVSRDETSWHLILCCWDSDERITGSADPQKVKNLIFCSLVNVTNDSYPTAFKAGSHFQTVSGQMTNAIKEKSFDSHGMFIDHNTAFWYVLLEGELSPEYQWSPTDRQIEWEYHQGPIHISCFSIAVYSLLLCSILPCTIHFLSCFPPPSITYFSLFSLLLLSALPSFTPLMFCV